MSLNCKEIEQIIKTFPEESRIIKISSADPYSISLLISYNSSQHPQEKKFNSVIVISTESNNNRIFMDMIIDKTNTSHRFAQKLDSFLSGYSIIKIYQHEFSRIVILQIKKKNEIYNIIARLWNTRSNILLTDEHYKIIDSLTRYPKIKEWPGETFCFPDKKNCNYEIRAEFQGGNINSLVKEFFERKNKKNYYNKLMVKLIKFLTEQENYFLNSLENLEKYINDENPASYLQQGELLKANLHLLKKGMHHITLIDYNSQREITIDLNPLFTPAQNIQHHFKKYKKVKNAIEKKQQTFDKLSVNLQKIKEYKEKIDKISLDNSINLEKLQELQIKITKEFGNISSFKQKSSNQGEQLGRHFTLSNGKEAIVSRNGKEADQILKKLARGNDYWFHIRDFPGSHVIVKREKNKELDQQSKIEAAHLAIYFSKARNATVADVMFTMIKYIHKNKKNAPGLVFPSQEKNIRVKFNNDIIKKIFSRNRKIIY